MRVDFKQGFTDTKGEPISELTLGILSCNALNGIAQNDNVSAEERYKRGKIISEIQEGKEEFTIEEVALIKKCIGKQGFPSIVYQAWEMLEAKNDKLEE